MPLYQDIWYWRHFLFNDTTTRQKVSGGRPMENKKRTSLPEPLDLTLWREFQDGLSAILNMPVSLYDSRGALLAPPSRESALCSAIKSNEASLARFSSMPCPEIAFVAPFIRLSRQLTGPKQRSWSRSVSLKGILESCPR